MSAFDETQGTGDTAPVDGSTVSTDPSVSGDTNALLQQILQQQQEHRAEVAQLRDEVNRARTTPAPATPTTAPTEDELRQQRHDQVKEHDYYCPGCGKLVDYPQQCTGTATAPHAPIEVVSTDELHADADPANHTAAPATDVPR